MKLIKTANSGYINVEKIESYSVRKTIANRNLDIIYEFVAYRADCEFYILGKCESESDAWIYLETLAKWLTDGEDGIFDVIRTRKSDNDD